MKRFLILIIFLSFFLALRSNINAAATCTSVSINPTTGVSSTVFTVVAEGCTAPVTGRIDLNIEQNEDATNLFTFGMTETSPGRWEGTITSLSPVGTYYIAMTDGIDIIWDYASLPITADVSVICGDTVAIGFAGCPASCPSSEWSDGTWKCGTEPCGTSGLICCGGGGPGGTCNISTLACTLTPGSDAAIDSNYRCATAPTSGSTGGTGDGSDVSPSTNGVESCRREDPSGLVEEDPGCVGCIEQGGIWTAIGCIDPTPVGIVTGIIRIALGVMGGVAVVQLIIAGMYYQSGDQAKIEEAKGKIKQTIGGVAILIFSVLILRIIGVNVLDVVPEGIF